MGRRQRSDRLKRTSSQAPPFRSQVAIRRRGNASNRQASRRARWPWRGRKTTRLHPRKPRTISRSNWTPESQRVAVRVVERGGEVHVAVRTPTRPGGGLRQGLPSLAAKLEQTGFPDRNLASGSRAAPPAGERYGGGAGRAAENRTARDRPSNGVRASRSHGKPRNGPNPKRKARISHGLCHLSVNGGAAVGARRFAASGRFIERRRRTEGAAHESHHGGGRFEFLNRLGQRLRAASARTSSCSSWWPRFRTRTRPTRWMARRS